LERFADFSRAIQFRKGEGLPGRVWESKEPTWIPDIDVDQNFPRRKVAVEAGLHGAFAFPLVAGKALTGVLELFSPHPVEPDPDLLRLVEALGSQIGLFIERRRIESELQREKEKAEAANAAKDRFLAMLSHELRTPLTPVLVWAGGMADEPELSDEIQQGLRMICRNIELEARLIDDLLDLTRITRGKLKLQRAPADVHELLQHALEIVRSEMQDRHLRFVLSLDASRHDLLLDAPRLQQVFWNLFRNAYKYTPEEGTISVRTFNPDANRISIEISDNGAGIQPQFLEKIFDAFEQVDAAREGLGLGLAISKAIVEMHGGSIRAQSDGLGAGATFVIELPVGPAVS
jgi:two-component system CheB/CheR fusion protein